MTCSKSESESQEAMFDEATNLNGPYHFTGPSLLDMRMEMRKQVQEYIRNEVKVQLENHRRTLDEKCEDLFVKVPVLESLKKEISIMRENLEKERIKGSRVRELELRAAEIATLKEELHREKEKRKENQGHFSDLVETLMEEIVQLSANNAVLEERLGEIEKGNSSVGRKVCGVPREQAPAWNSSSRMRTPSPTIIIPTVKNSTDAKQTRVHQKAPVPGRNLPIACLCGMEFASDTRLSVHIGQNTVTMEDVEGASWTQQPSTSSSAPAAFPLSTSTTSASNSSLRKRPREDKAHGKNPFRQKSEIAGSTSAPSCSTNAKIATNRVGKHHGKDLSRQLHCLCGMKYHNNVTLYDHIRFFTGMNLLQCKTCGKQFVYASQLKIHYQQVHRSKFILATSNWKNLPGANGRRGSRKGKRMGKKPTSEEIMQIKIEVPESAQTRQDLENTHRDKAGFFSYRPGADDRLFCLCNEVSYGKMIACDNEKCTTEWFHFKCVGITSDPDINRTWYCPQCRQNIPGPPISSNPGSKLKAKV